MAAKMTIQTRTQLPVYTAETLAAKNPVLLKGEVVYESDTRKHKVGDGTTAWNSLPYAGGVDTPDTIPAANVEQDASHRFVTDTEKDRWNAVSPSVPNLIWKVSEGSFLIKPSCSLDDPILAQCYIGFIRYKRRRNRKDRRVMPYRDRPDDIGYHLVDTDDFPKPEWAVEKLSPIPFDIEQAKASNGWMRVNKVRTICARFIEEVADSTYAQNIRLIIHNGTSTDTKLNMGKDKYGLIKQFASVRCGIVMFTGKPEKRIEGNRSYFKACCSNVGSGYFLR